MRRREPAVEDPEDRIVRQPGIDHRRGLQLSTEPRRGRDDDLECDAVVKHRTDAEIVAGPDDRGDIGREHEISRIGACGYGGESDEEGQEKLVPEWPNFPGAGQGPDSKPPIFYGAV